MTVKGEATLAVAARSGRIGYVVLRGGRLQTWGTSEKAAGSPECAAGMLRHWINTHSPETLVSENPEDGSLKGKPQRDILRAWMAVGDELALTHLVIVRTRHFANLYEEAAAMAAHWPELAPSVPEKPPIWKSEPYRMVWIEALALLYSQVPPEERIES